MYLSWEDDVRTDAPSTSSATDSTAAAAAAAASSASVSMVGGHIRDETEKD